MKISTPFITKYPVKHVCCSEYHSMLKGFRRQAFRIVMKNIYFSALLCRPYTTPAWPGRLPALNSPEPESA